MNYSSFLFPLSYKERAMRRRETESAPDREARIRTHYAREVAQGHLGADEADERLLGDLGGQNRHPEKPQRQAAAKSI